MAIFTNQATLRYNGGSTNSNIAYGEILEVLEATKTVTVLTPGEACMGIVSITVMAFIAAGITMIYQVESLPLSMAILIHGGVLYLDYLMIYLLNSWLPGNAVGIFTIIFFAGFALVWLVIYLCIRKKTQRLNEKMKARQ